MGQQPFFRLPARPRRSGGSGVKIHEELLHGDPAGGEHGVVVAVHGDRTVLPLAAGSACEKCRLCRQVSAQEMALTARCDAGVRPGDRGTVSIDPAVRVRAALVAFALPLAALLGGYLAGSVLTPLLRPRMDGELLPAL